MDRVGNFALQRATNNGHSNGKLFKGHPTNVGYSMQIQDSHLYPLLSARYVSIQRFCEKKT